ncbi:hypothetical protein UO65_4179 [Actinokineospora spheciospongiae]|uniref:YdhG-like domain-containing protein n=1 Tax=Actinokineospora spheciospongiae TaxID=909613 RepID=W7IVQ9_9PSEU|nr:DUF1801 domain-containing protein [Actinokineospora spheciospongiae]EWC60511.1 hypothetical protein UO65_4179 [Actinokineospora spheciospongiae]PWW57040.1 uncharacterized protein DUF1801 [Actinokineospora spheciospongiae]
MPKFATVDEYTAALAEPLREIVEGMRPVLSGALPEATEGLFHGAPTWSVGKARVCFVKAHGSHVAFALWRGQDVEDASGRLEAMSNRMAQVRLRSASDIDPAVFAGWLRQALALEG